MPRSGVDERSLGSRDAYLEVASDFASRGGRIDAIVNNAMSLHYCPVQEVEPARLGAMLDGGVSACG